MTMGPHPVDPEAGQAMAIQRRLSGRLQVPVTAAVEPQLSRRGSARVRMAMNLLGVRLLGFAILCLLQLQPGTAAAAPHATHGNVPPPPQMRSAFLDIYADMQSWQQDDWDRELAGMQDAGFDSVILAGAVSQ